MYANSFMQKKNLWAFSTKKLLCTFKPSQHFIIKSLSMFVTVITKMRTLPFLHEISYNLKLWQVIYPSNYSTWLVLVRIETHCTSQVSTQRLLTLIQSFLDVKNVVTTSKQRCVLIGCGIILWLRTEWYRNVVHVDGSLSVNRLSMFHSSHNNYSMYHENLYSTLEILFW